jgi:PAS domain S-box-containing protein
METKRFTNTSFPLLVGGYEMGELIRSIDWSGSSLGPIDTWPQSLRATLNVMLNSAVPMCLFWGPEFSCFYNDAFQPVFGEKEKYPLAMGQPGHLVWLEVWPVINPLLNNVLEKGQAALSSDQLLPTYRNGHLEDVYWTLRYSPAFDDNAKPAGVLVTGSETAKENASLRQLTENRDQLFFAIDAAELGTWDLNLSTHRFTANDRYKSWLGLPSKADVELSTVLEAVSETDREHVAQAIWKALQPNSTSQYDVVYTLSNAGTRQKRTVRAKGRAYFSQDGKPYRFAGTVQDITEQVTAREQMEQAEELAKLALEGANTGSFFIDLTDNSLIHSATLGRVFTGRDVEGMTRAQLLTYIHPDD